MYTGTATHTTLLARLSGDNPDAWAEFHARYGDLIRSFCLRRGLQPADSEDVTQDVLLALTKAMPGFQYDPAKGRFRSYLKTVVVHAIARRMRQNQPATPLSQAGDPSEAGGSDDDDHWETEWQRYHFARALTTIRSEFNAADVRAFELYAVEGHDAKETAQELGMSPDAVYQAKSRILRRLSAIIEAQVAEEG